MKIKNQRSAISVLSLALVLGLSLSACGQQKMLAESDTASNVLKSTPKSSSGTGSSDTPIDLDDGDAGNLSDPYLFDVRGLGNTTPVKITIKTTTALQKIRLRYTAKPQDDFALTKDTKTGKLVKSGYAPNYSIFGLSISIDGKENRTPPLRSGLYGSQQSSPIYEYAPKAVQCIDSASASSVKTPSQLSMQAAVAVKVTKQYCYTITFSNPVYDYHCLTRGPQFCPYTNIEPLHPWVGSVEIQTDETSALK